MKKERFYFLYKTINKINGKYYIGVHSTHQLNDGYIGSGKRLRYAVRKYGKESFLLEIIEFFDSSEKMYEAEKNMVNIEFIKDELCMNLREGGIGGWTKEQQILNAKKSNLKKKELRENNPEWKENEKKRNSHSMKMSYQNGTRVINVPNCLGKKHKPETINKMKKSKNVGSNNSQFGTKWINKNGIVKKTKLIDLEFYINEGWILGKK